VWFGDWTPDHLRARSGWRVIGYIEGPGARYRNVERFAPRRVEREIVAEDRCVCCGHPIPPPSLAYLPRFRE
jgi:hypothetical protein